MLVLSRKVGERVLVGDNIVLTVTEMRIGKVRIGIEAPPDVKIVRAELDQPVPGVQVLRDLFAPLAVG